MDSEKRVSSREFLHSFGELSEKLRAGESITITKHGKPVGTFTKQPEPVKAPDYLGNIRKLGISRRASRKLTEELLKGL